MRAIVEAFSTLPASERGRIAAHVVALIAMSDKRRNAVVALTEADE